MEYAAAATMEETRGQPSTVGGFCAFLRLRQGASSRATWVLEESKGGTMISVGADEACDWQLRAAFVPARAFSLLVVGGRAFVRSGPEPGVLLDGKPIDDGWVQVPHGGRIDVGLARLEVTLGYADTSGQLVESLEKVQASQQRTAQDVPLTTPRKKSQKSAGRTTMNLGSIAVEQLRRLEPSTQPSPQQASVQAPSTHEPSTDEPVLLIAAQAAERTIQAVKSAAARKGPLNSTIELKLEDLYVEPARVVEAHADQQTYGALQDDVAQARMPGHQSGEFEVGAMPREDGVAAPALLEDEAPTDKRRWWRYAVAGAATAGAYGGWVMLLDRL